MRFTLYLKTTVSRVLTDYILLSLWLWQAIFELNLHYCLLLEKNGSALLVPGGVMLPKGG
jgi:hypothetical protein